MLGAFATKRFEIIRCLGEGGMGVVYEALDRERGGRLAVKTLRHTSPEHLARLKREFRAMQDLHHQNIVALHELLNDEGRWLMTMDLVDGVDMLTHVRAPAFAEAPVLSVSEILAVESAPTIPMSRSIPADQPVFEEEPLRSAMLQLAQGLDALHSAGMVHRDVKPSNVLVTREGRVVLLDFGLVTDALGSVTAHAVVGTPAYMAPEQAVSGDVGSAADWYAVGVMLYEALAGRLPFAGAALHVMLRKQSETPAAPSTLAPGVPPDLDALCLSLLRFDPSTRPKGEEVLRRLGANARERASTPLSRSGRYAAPSQSGARTLSPPFVGRAKETHALFLALQDSRKDGVAVLVEGESGVGKSRLVRHFLERLSLEDPQAIIVAGRCYERESVPYKAFDGVVDALSRLLERMPDAQVRELLPTRLAPLVQIFPVLRRVPAVAERTRTPHAALDPFELRSRAFVGLRELFTRAGEIRPLTVVIDDAQWADHDSVALLAEITRMPEAPRMLLVLTVRGGNTETTIAGQSRTIARVANAIGVPAREIAVRALSTDESRELAVALSGSLSDGGLTDGDFDTIAKEACGHPLFVDLLTRAAEARMLRSKYESRPPPSLEAGHGPARPATLARPKTSPKAFELRRGQLGPPQLAEALAEEMDALDPATRTLLELVAVAGAPLAQSVAERASELLPDRFARAMQHLRVARFVVTTGARADDRIEPYHDRVRLAVASTVNEAEKRALHRRIALALETDADADPEALAHHWRDAGDAEQAARFSARAGDRATQALAFERAASFYEQALAVDPPTTDARRDLLVKLGNALANAGRGKRAAESFREAARGAPSAAALELQRRAAEELLRSGHFDEGLNEIRTVLRAVGMSLPRNAFWALASLVVLRLLVRLRGLRFTPRDATEISPAELTRIDICWSVAVGLSLTDTIYGALFQLRNLLLSLRAGERKRIARAISMQAPHVGCEGRGSLPRLKALLATGERAAQDLPSAEVRAWATVSRGAAQYLVGEFPEAREACDAALAVFRGECAGAHWESSVAIQFGVQSLFYLGELKELARRTSAHLREALDRGDLYAAVILRTGDPSTVSLVADDPAACRANVDAAMREWSKTGFHVEHYYELYTRTNIDPLPGRAERRVCAHARAMATAPAVTAHARAVRPVHDVGLSRARRDRCRARRVGPDAEDPARRRPARSPQHRAGARRVVDGPRAIVGRRDCVGLPARLRSTLFGSFARRPWGVMRPICAGTPQSPGAASAKHSGRTKGQPFSGRRTPGSRVRASRGRRLRGDLCAWIQRSRHCRAKAQLVSPI